MGSAHHSESLKHLALASLPPATSPVSLKPLGRDPSPLTSRPIERSAASRACLMLRLKNDGVLCYVNATLIAFEWGMLQRINADWSDFNNGERGFHSLLTGGQFHTFAFETGGFEGLQGRWGTTNQQEDAHEFTAALLEWCQPRCVNVQWSRRLQHPNYIATYDQGSRGMPPTWHNHGGMKTCFESNSDLIGLHLDRLTRTHQGEVCRAEWTVHLDNQVILPFWAADHNMLPCWDDYVPVAVVFHSGSMHSGHLQSALRTPQGWFLTDDGRIALHDPLDLQGILKDICYIWLVRDEVWQLAPIEEPLYGKDEWILRAMWYIHHGMYRKLKQDATLLHIMRSSCADCGAPFFGSEGLYEHIELHHSGLGLGLRDTYERLILELNEVNIPCGLCLAKFHPDRPVDMNARLHICPVGMNLALAVLYFHSALSPVGARYEIPPKDDAHMLAGLERLPARQSTLPPANDPLGAFLEALLR